MRSFLTLCVVLCGLSSVLFPAAALADTTITLDGQAPDDDSRFFDIPFEVPFGTEELQVHHQNLTSGNILDWGVAEPDGTVRGWGGGNDEDAIIGLNASSRSYLIGPMPNGKWSVIVGKAKITAKPAKYHVVITTRSLATLPAQTERQPYVPVPPLSSDARWYAGDFHVHSRQSGDARPSLDEIANFARSRGLDFVHLSDHNTHAQLDYILDAQGRHPDLLFVPGVEFTTYQGHANGIGATVHVDSRLGYQGRTLEKARQAFADQGAIFSINHPTYDVSDALCIGCAWTLPIPSQGVDAVEIGNGGWSETGFLFGEAAIAFWDGLCASGVHAKALGGSDDHRGGEVPAAVLSSPIGDPTTMVFATELSVQGILEGIRNGRTVVKLQGPDDPMIDFTATGARQRDTVVANSSHLTAVITGGQGTLARFVRNGMPQEPVTVTSDPFTLETDARPPATGEDRWRVEVLVDGHPRTVTSHIFLGTTFDPPQLHAPMPTPRPALAACAQVPGGTGAWLVLVAMGSLLLRRRSHSGN